MTNELDTSGAVSEFLNGRGFDPAVPLRQSMLGAVGANPQAEADLQRAARRVGVSTLAARVAPDDVRRAATLQAFDFGAMVRDYPQTAAFLANQDNARIAHDDIGPLSAMESAVGKAARYVMGADQRGGLPGDVGRAFGAGWSGVKMGAAGLYGALAAPMGVGDQLLQALDDAAAAITGTAKRQIAGAPGPESWLLGKARELDAAGKASMPEMAPDAGNIERGVWSGFQSAGQNLATLPLAVINPALMLGVMGAETGGQSYLKARDEGKSALQASAFGAQDATAEIVTEKFLGAAGFMERAMAGSSAAKLFMYELAKEVPGEIAATLWQNFNEWANLKPQQSLADWLKEQPDAVVQTIVATLVGGGAQIGAVKAVERAARGPMVKQAQADAAQGSAQALGELAMIAEASKLRQRDPESFAGFAQELADAGTPNLYVDAQVLNQSGVDLAAVAQALPSVAAQIQVALATGGDLVIPTSEFLTIAPGQDFAAPLIEHARTAPDAMSAAEAQQYMAERGDAVKAEVERVLAERQGDDAFKAARDEVAAGFKAQLDAAGRFTSDVNSAYASMLGNFYAVQAAKLGVTPAELAQRYPLQITAQGVPGVGVLDQGPATLDEATGLPLNDDGTVTVYHHTSAEKAAEIRRTGVLKSAGEPDLYFTTTPETSTGYGDTAVPFRVKPERLMLDDAFPDGRQDFRVAAPAKARRVWFKDDGTGVLNQDARAQISLNPTGATITLFKGADLSSFIHEAGHFFLEVQADLAARIQAQINDGASVTDGERQIVADTNKLLAWFGVKDTPEASALTQWHAMTLEEKRGMHEKFARGFEAYAFEGRAPSLELQSLFQRFRAWMLNVYRELKALNVDLTDEVRGVMDRMLASTQAIQEAEAARDMGAIFKTADEAGMTLEEFQAYHDLAVEATQEAIQNLQARGLRDMRWLDNAKSRKLKEMQKLSEGLRREVRAEVRGEVMSQPIYRAWQFLTGKGEAQDTAAPDAKAKGGSMLDPSKDSLLVAIAKLGGISRESAARDLSTSADYFAHPSGVFGKPVFRKEGGMSADYMAESLAEAGYLPVDGDGKHSIRDLEDALSDELHGAPRYSTWHDYAASMGEAPVQALPESVLFGKLDTAALREMYGDGPQAIWRKLSALRMTSQANGVAPDVVADTFGFSSGDELVQALAAADPPRVVIEGMTDQRMLERFGDLATPEGLARAVDRALHDQARGRFLAAETAALERATSVREAVPGQRRTVDVLARQARATAAAVLARLKVRDIRPGEYAAAEARAARTAAKAMAAGKTEDAAAAKRNQLIQHHAARQAYAAQDEIQALRDYLRRFEKRPKSVDPAYLDQIEALLERFDLKAASLKAIDKRKTLAAWAESQREQGMEPDIPDDLLNEANRKSWRDMTLEELRGLRDTVKQIEHLGRLKNRLLTSQAKREFEAVRDEIADSIVGNAGNRQADTRTPATVLGRALQSVRNFGAAHIKAATWARVFDGGKDGGPVWEYLIRTANDRGDMEATMRAEATAKLHEIVQPLFDAGKMGGSGRFFPSIKRSLNREQIIAMALNTGNEGNWQRMLGGEGWTAAQVQPVLNTLSAADWRAVQAIWDHFETYRPAIGAKERRVYGKEPNWVEPVPRTVTAAGGEQVALRGGYYPIKYDPLASNRAEQHNDAEAAKRQLQGAYTSATTRRGFTKARAEEVNGRPLLYSLAGVYSGVNDVIHDLAWHEWLIDVNKILRSDKIDSAIREHYGPAAVRQFKTWVQDIAEGDKGLQAELDSALGKLRHGVSVAGLGFNVMSAAMQPLGFNQSVSRVGAKWVGRGIAQFIASPVGKTREVNEMSEFMANRQRTRFRELAELRNQVEGQTKAREAVGRYAYWLMMRAQQLVDVPTWMGAYERATAEGNDEARAVALADQAVIDSQGGGQTKDLSAIERGGPAQKLFTVFYSFMNTAANLGVAQTMTAEKSAKGRAKLAAQYLLLYSVPALLGAVLKDALTPGDAGDDDERKLLKKLLAAQLEYLMGLMVVVREFSGAGKAVFGLEDNVRDYSGPAGLRLITDAQKLAVQVQQGEFDDAFRKAFVNMLGDLAALPAAQVNRTITGAKALNEGKTSNPAALLFGFQEPH